MDSSKKEEELNQLSEVELGVLKVKLSLKPGVKGGSFKYKNNNMFNSMESKRNRKGSKRKKR